MMQARHRLITASHLGCGSDTPPAAWPYAACLAGAAHRFALPARCPVALHCTHAAARAKPPHLCRLLRLTHRPAPLRTHTAGARACGLQLTPVFRQAAPSRSGAVPLLPQRGRRVCAFIARHGDIWAGGLVLAMARGPLRTAWTSPLDDGWRRWDGRSLRTASRQPYSPYTYKPPPQRQPAVRCRAWFGTCTPHPATHGRPRAVLSAAATTAAPSPHPLHTVSRRAHFSRMAPLRMRAHGCAPRARTRRVPLRFFQHICRSLGALFMLPFRRPRGTAACRHTATPSCRYFCIRRTTPSYSSACFCCELRFTCTPHVRACRWRLGAAPFAVAWRDIFLKLPTIYASTYARFSPHRLFLDVACLRNTKHKTLADTRYARYLLAALRAQERLHLKAAAATFH